MSEEDILNIKFRLLDLFVELDNRELDIIEAWIGSLSYKEALETKRSLKKTEKILDKIGDSIKKLVPFEAELKSEKILPPTIGDQADCNKINTMHVDEFLYDEDKVSELVEQKKLTRHYCLDCHSRNTEELIFISHSMSKQALQYIFKVLLPSDLTEKKILDVGSRLGAVLYAAFYFSNASTIVGVEMNEDCCEVQNKIITQFNMDSNRIKVIHSDVMEVSDLVKRSDIVIINVLDFFVDIEKHKKMWYFFKNNLKNGSYLISNRSMNYTLNILGLLEELNDWLSICKPHQPENEMLFNIEDYSEIFIYKIN